MWQARKRFFFAQNAWFFPDALKFENNISWKAWKRKSFGTITDLLIPKKNFIFLLDKTFFFRWPGLRPYGPPKKKILSNKKKKFFFGINRSEIVPKLLSFPTAIQDLCDHKNVFGKKHLFRFEMSQKDLEKKIIG